MYKAKLESMHLNPSHLQQEMIHSKAMQSNGKQCYAVRSGH